MVDIQLDSYYFVDLLHNKGYIPQSNEEEQSRQIAHLKHLNKLTEEGIILVAGPIGGGDGVILADMEVTNEELLQKKLSQDPHIKAGSHTFKIRTLYVPKHSMIFTMKQYNLMMGNELKHL